MAAAKKKTALDSVTKIVEALTDGWRVVGLHATDGGSTVRVALVDADGSLRLESTQTEGSLAEDLVVGVRDPEHAPAVAPFGVEDPGEEPLAPVE